MSNLKKHRELFAVKKNEKVCKKGRRDNKDF